MVKQRSAGEGVKSRKSDPASSLASRRCRYEDTTATPAPTGGLFGGIAMWHGLSLLLQALYVVVCSKWQLWL